MVQKEHSKEHFPKFQKNVGQYRDYRSHFAQGYNFWSNLYKTPWSSLQCLNHYRQKIAKVWRWNWKSNIFFKLHLQASFFFFIHQLSESLEIRKILAKSNMHSRTQSSRTATLTPKSSIQNIQNIQNSFSIKNYQLV